MLDVKKHMNFERKLPKDEREIYMCLKPFARFMSKEEFEELFNGLILEKKLKQRLNQLNAFQEAGLTTYESIEKFLEVDARRNKEYKKKTSFFDSSSVCIKLANQIKSTNDDLSNFEKDFIKRKNIPIPVYNEIKNKISKDSINCIKAILSENINDLEREDVDEIVDFVVQIKKYN